jgi:hypothetical protein
MKNTNPQSHHFKRWKRAKTTRTMGEMLAAGKGLKLGGLLNW